MTIHKFRSENLKEQLQKQIVSYYSVKNFYSMNPFNLKPPVHIGSDIQNQGQAALNYILFGHKFKGEACRTCKRKGFLCEKTLLKIHRRKFTNLELQAILTGNVSGSMRTVSHSAKSKVLTS